MKEIPTFDAGRVTLRPFDEGDATDVQRLAGDKAIADTTLNIPHPYENGMAEEWISKHRSAFEEEKALTLAIILKENGSLVGAISLMDISKNHQAELGYWVGKPYWNRGFCTAAGARLLAHAFTELSLVRISACHISRNSASGRVMQKLGMAHEGTRRQYVKKWDNFEDMEMYGVLKVEWEKTVNKSLNTEASNAGTG